MSLLLALTGAAPPPDVTGVATTSQAQTIAGTGGVAAMGQSGSAATSQAQTSSATGSSTPQAITGNAATSQRQTVAAAGTSAPQAITGTATTRQAQTTTATGASASAGISGTGSTSQGQSSAASGVVSGGEVAPTARLGFEINGIPTVSFKPLLQRIKEARAERIKPAKKSARRKARVIEGQAVDLVLSGGGESAFNELMRQWVRQEPVLPAQPSINLEQLFMAQVAIHIRRIEEQDEEDALIALLVAQQRRKNHEYI